MEKHGLGGEPLLFRVSGCPNGCSRPYLAEIALVGKAPGRYNLHLGGARDGRRLSRALSREPGRAGDSSPRSTRCSPPGRWSARRARLSAISCIAAGGSHELRDARAPQACRRPIDLVALNAELRALARRGTRRARRANCCPRRGSSRRRFGAQAAVSLHLVTRALPRHPGRPDRYRLPVPGDLPLRR